MLHLNVEDELTAFLPINPQVYDWAGDLFCLIVDYVVGRQFDVVALEVRKKLFRVVELL